MTQSARYGGNKLASLQVLWHVCRQRVHRLHGPFRQLTLQVSELRAYPSWAELEVDQHLPRDQVIEGSLEPRSAVPLLAHNAVPLPAVEVLVLGGRARAAVESNQTGK